MKLSVLIFRESALRVKQIDKAEDKQNHGKQRGQKDSMQLAVALKDQLLLSESCLRFFCGFMGSPRLELSIEEGLIGGVRHIRDAKQENADQKQRRKHKARTAPREHEMPVKRPNPWAAAKNAEYKKLPVCCK